jgi:hypothetical protein
MSRHRYVTEDEWWFEYRADLQSLEQRIWRDSGQGPESREYNRRVSEFQVMKRAEYQHLFGRPVALTAGEQLAHMGMYLLGAQINKGNCCC